MTDHPEPPDTLADDGRRLWLAVLDHFELEPAELEVLRHAAELTDRAAEAARVLADVGLVAVDRYGSPKVHPLAAEERNNRATAARLLASLGIAPAKVATSRARPGPSARAKARAERFA